MNIWREIFGVKLIGIGRLYIVIGRQLIKSAILSDQLISSYNWCAFPPKIKSLERFGHLSVKNFFTYCTIPVYIPF